MSNIKNGGLDQYGSVKP